MGMGTPAIKKSKYIYKDKLHMKQILLICVFYFFSFLISISYAQTTVTLVPSQDASVGFHDGFNSANTNYGTADYFSAFYQPIAIYGENGGRSLLNFDLSIIPGGVSVISAELNLYGRGSYGIGEAVSHGNYGQNECYLQRITTSWIDNIVTWNDQPNTTSTNQVILPQSIDSIQDYLNINVSQLVQDMINDPNNSYGFLIQLVTESLSRSLAFCSKDFSDSAKHPQLIITYWCVGSTLIKFPVQDATIGFHDGFNSANTNYETADYYSAFSQPAAVYGENAGEGLMEFDLSDIPSDATIVAASLDLFGRGPYGIGDAVSIGNTGQNNSYLQRITSSWDESTVTWNYQPSTTTINEVALMMSNFAIEDYPGIDVTQLVQDMVDSPSASYGIKFILETEDPTRSLAFCSKNYPDSTKFPKLTLTYSCDKATFIPSLISDEGVKIYPSLTTGNITVEVSQQAIIQSPFIQIFDLHGKQLYSKKLKTISTICNLSGLSNNIYFYQILTANKIIGYGKIILEE